MQTEFTCGIYRAKKYLNEWIIEVNQYILARTEDQGLTIAFEDLPIKLSIDDLIEISVLMNNIKRQYKQLQTT